MKLEDRLIVESALIWFGENPSRFNDVEVCEDGSVWLGLTEILPSHSVGEKFTDERQGAYDERS